MGNIFEYTPKNWGSNVTDESPIVSVVITSYNQKELALVGLKSLFNQDYKNLEIIISDDCSADGSVEVLLEECKKEEAKASPFRILFNVNAHNLGVTKNYEYGFRLAQGELIVTAGGDDISYPNRVSCIVSNWVNTGKKAAVIFHKVRTVNYDGTPGGYEWWPMTLRNPIGAAMAYSCDVIKKFPEISINDSFEDNVFCRRGYLIGEVLYIEDKLIDYRVGSGVTSTGDYRLLRQKISKCMVASTKQNQIDIEFVRGQAPDDKIKFLEELVSEVSTTYDYEYRMISSKSPFERFKYFTKYVKRDRRMKDLSLSSFLNHYVQLMYPSVNKLVSPVLMMYRELKNCVNKNEVDSNESTS